MATFGLQVFRDDGSLDFDSEDGHTWRLISKEVVTITPDGTLKYLTIPIDYTHDKYLITYSVTQGQVLYEQIYGPDRIRIRQIATTVPDGIATFYVFGRGL